MLSTGVPEIDNLFKKASSISSKHKIIAEWNQNAYVGIDYLGSYPLDIKADGIEEGNTYASTFDENQENNGWDNGGYFYTVSSTGSADPVENITRSKLTGLKEIVSPERPDPGIVYPIPYHSLDATIPSDNISIYPEVNDLRTYNLLNSSNRMYAINESQSFRYWTSVRYCKPNTTVSPNISWSLIGVSDANGAMKGNNVFVHYQTAVITNKIVVKTQTMNGYPKSFTVQVLRPGSNVWTNIYQATNSTTMSDGILRLTANLVSESMVWTVSEGVETEATVTDLKIDTVPDVDQIVGIRFSVQELSRTNGTLDVIEVSPRLVVDMTSYTSEFSKNSSLGDSTLGLPVGSMVTASGNIRFFNDDNLISNKNVDSLLNGLLKPDVKFTILNVVESESNIKYIPIKIMYAESWDEESDWTVSVPLQDYMKFFNDTPAPDILMGALDGINVSAIIKILLDNAGFTRYSFNKTADTEEYLTEDTRLDFFWSRKEMSIAEVLGEVARSAQLSIFFDQYGYLTVMTKEAVMQKTDTWDYTLVGDYAEVSSTDEEYAYINNNYLSNIENFEDSVIPPITAGEVAYSGLGIPKISYQLVEKSLSPGSQENPFSGISQDTANLVDSGYSELSINRNLAYNPQQVWLPGSQESGDRAALLASGILVKDLESSRPTTILSGDTFEAKNKNDAIRQAYETMSQAEKDSCQIVIAENDMAVSYRNKFSGHVLVDAEIVKFNGIVYYISRPGFAAQRKIYFSENEVNADLYAASTPSGSSFVPYALLVNMDMAVSSYPTTSSLYVFYCKSDGRGFNGTKVVKHYCGLAESNNWTRFSSKLYSAATGNANYGQQMKIAVDVKLPNLATLSDSTQAYGGYAKLVGPPTNSEKNTEVPSEDARNDEILIDDVGQQFITGFKKDVGFIPTRIGTRMNIHSVLDSNGQDTLSKIAGIAFYLSGAEGGSTGYFLEVSSVAENYQADNPKQNNVRLYKVFNDSGTIKPKLLGTAWWNGATGTTFERSIQFLKQNEGSSSDSSRAVFSLEIGISDDRKKFTVYFNGSPVKDGGGSPISFIDDSPLSPTNNIAIFSRDDSNAIYDYIYAVSTPNGVYPSISSTGDYDSAYSVALDAGKNRGIFSPYIKQMLGSETPVYYDDFGSAVREAKFIEARYNEPTFSAKLIDMSRVSPDYFIKDFKGTSWGASFWIYNTSRQTISIGQGSDYPLFISGFPLRKINQGVIKIGDYLGYQDDSVINDQLDINRRLYGEQSVNISAEYLNNYNVAEDLAEWIARYASREKIQIDASIFPNPLLQLGDRIKVFYKARGYCNSVIGDKTYVLSEIDYTVNDSGIQMNVSLREMI